MSNQTKHKIVRFEDGPMAGEERYVDRGQWRVEFGFVGDWRTVASYAIDTRPQPDGTYLAHWEGTSR